MTRYRVPARVGLFGNPSDGFGGKTISCLVKPYAAEVSIIESRELTIQPNPMHDPIVFSNLAALHRCATSNGYYGGLRLMWATCKRFLDYLREADIKPPSRNFTMWYDTSIPRQVGLAGSSAIITATLKCLIHFYDIAEEALPVAIQPNLILQAETRELGIAAGLQDRVVQVYGGLVYMDFHPSIMESQGHGEYELLPLDLLPPLFIAYTRTPSDSSRIHSPIRERFDRGEPEVVEAMQEFAAVAEAGRAALLARDFDALTELLDDNWALRRKVYGDAALGHQNLQMVAIAREHGVSAKLAGSGGGVVGFCQDVGQFEELRCAFRERHYECVLGEPTESLPAEEVAWEQAEIPLTHEQWCRIATEVAATP